MIEIRVVDQYEAFAGMEAVWDELVAASGEDNPFRRWLWAWTWWKHYGPGHRLAIVLAWEGAELVGLAPLYFQAESFPLAGRSLRLLGSNEVCSEYLGLVLRRGREARVVPALLEFLFDRWAEAWDMFRWTDLPEESREVALMESFLQARRLPYARRLASCNLQVHFPETWDQYAKRLSKHRLARLRSTSRKYEGFKAVEYVTASTPEQFRCLWDELRTLHNRHWAGIGQRGLFTLPQYEAFHTEVARAYFDRGQLLLASLRVEGEPIASSYSIRQGTTVYEYQRGIELARGTLQPGQTLQLHLFRRAIEQGVLTWDYLRGDYPYKHVWANAQRQTVTLIVPARRLLPVQRFRCEQTLGSVRHQLGRALKRSGLLRRK